MLRVVLLAAALLLAPALLAPTAAADAVCTPWTGTSTSKSRACVNPDGGVDCLVYGEGWSHGTYYRICWLGGADAALP